VAPVVQARLRDLFERVVALPAGDRERWLGEACAGDEGLYAAVFKLLTAHGRVEDGLTLSPHIAAALGLASLMPQVIAGTRLGPYQIVREIGRGGMGSVYLACRADGVYTKAVALKLLLPESRDALERFEQEREIVARLDHPNIARLLDGGTTGDGVAYSVMEFIEGRPIDVFCEERRLDLRRRINLVRQVCDAVEYAHRHLVVHRDLKPSNILVTAEGTVKLLDFGIAKLLEGSGAAVTATADTHRFTLAYASPEQINGKRITTGTDVYSLGVVLYELLSGCRPYVGEGALHEVARAICEDEPAIASRVVCEPTPNRAASTRDASSNVAAARRATTPERLARSLKGELDNILLTTLRKEPERRYASVERLNDDLGRYLSDLPVLAQPATRRYRVRKFIARHRGQVAAVSLIAASLLAAVIGTTSQAKAARRAEYRAGQLATEAQMQATRAAQGTADADRYRQQAETQATLAQVRARLADARATEADAATRRAVDAQRRATRRAEDIRDMTQVLLTLSEATVDSRDTEDARRQGADAVERTLTSLRADGVQDPSMAANAVTARQLREQLESQRRLAVTPPSGWSFYGDSPDFDCGVTQDATRSGHVAYLRSRSAQILGSALLAQSVAAAEYAGKRVRVSAFLKSAAVDVYAALIFRTTQESFEHPIEARLRGSNDWDRYEVVLDVPTAQRTILIGVRLFGAGTVWADDFNIEAVDQSVPLTVPSAAPPVIDLGFRVPK
jgi:serine/threonine protein kinase